MKPNALPVTFSNASQRSRNNSDSGTAGGGGGGGRGSDGGGSDAGSAVTGGLRSARMSDSGMGRDGSVTSPRIGVTALRRGGSIIDSFAVGLSRDSSFAEGLSTLGAGADIPSPEAVAAAFAAGFEPAASFQGARPGYVFRTGDGGLGYYPDSGAAAARSGLTASSSAPAELQPSREPPGAASSGRQPGEGGGEPEAPKSPSAAAPLVSGLLRIRVPPAASEAATGSGSPFGSSSSPAAAAVAAAAAAWVPSSPSAAWAPSSPTAASTAGSEGSQTLSQRGSIGFIAAPTFLGVKEGYVYRAGPLGMGYYRAV